MTVLTPHDGNLGTSSWVVCDACVRPRVGLGWFAIRAGEPHLIDARTHKSYHRDCAEALVQRGEARIDRTEAA